MSANAPMNVEKALQFRVMGDWGHFRRIDTNTVKQTYRVIPRTTIAGMIGAILGRSRDSYYDEFAPEKTGIAISVDVPIQTRRMAMLELTSTSDETTTRNGHKMYRRNKTGTENRQQRLSEYLVDPSYTVTVATTQDTLHADLREALEAGQSVYTPCLGKTECLASIDFIGEDTLSKTRTKTVDTVAPTSLVEASGPIGVERTPRHFNLTDEGRTPSGFVSYAYNMEAEEMMLVEETEAFAVNDQAVLFV